MSLSGDISGGTQPPPPVYQEPATPQGAGRPKWILPVILGVVACCLIACLVGALLLGPTLGQSMNLATMCISQNPTASQEACQAWVTDVITNHQAAYTSCETSTGGDPSAMYQCLLDAGVSPP